jgi:hypothetical protein
MLHVDELVDAPDQHQQSERYPQHEHRPCLHATPDTNPSLATHVCALDPDLSVIEVAFPETNLSAILEKPLLEEVDVFPSPLPVPVKFTVYIIADAFSLPSHRPNRH